MNEVPYAFWSLPEHELLRQLNTASQGLSHEDAKQRLDQFGANHLTPHKRLHLFLLLVSQFKSPILLILLFAAGLFYVLHDSTDAPIIMGIIVFLYIMGAEMVKKLFYRNTKF